MKKSCKVEKIKGKTIIYSWNINDLQKIFWCEKELYNSLVDDVSSNQIKKYIEEVISYYKNDQCSKETLIRNVAMQLADINVKEPWFTQKIVFKLKKMWIEEKELWKWIYEEKEKDYSLDYILSQIEKIKNNLFTMLDSKIAMKPDNWVIINDIKTVQEFMNKFEVPAVILPMRNSLMNDYIHKASTYIYTNNPNEEELKFILSVDPLLVKASN